MTVANHKKGGTGLNNKVKIEEILETCGVYISPTVGKSMLPMLRSGRDRIVVSPKTGRLRKYDVALYKVGERYVLHRVIKVHSESGYDTRGDNCCRTEKNVSEDAVIGVLSGFYRDKKAVELDSFGYIMYSRVWTFLHPLIFAVKSIRDFFRRRKSDTNVIGEK